MTALSFLQLRNPFLNHNSNFASTRLNRLCLRLRLTDCPGRIRFAFDNLDLGLQLLVPFCAESKRERYLRRRWLYCVQSLSIAFLGHEEVLLEEMYSSDSPRITTRQKRTFKQEFEKHH